MTSVSFDDLKDGARAIAAFVERALEGKKFLRLDVGYDMCRRVLKRKCAVLDKHGQTAAVE